jgi:hypothetical protein
MIKFEFESNFKIYFRQKKFTALESFEQFSTILFFFEKKIVLWKYDN